jgi:hypothetical protein
MNKPLLTMAKTASALMDSRRELDECKARLSAFEKRAAAEKVLLEAPDHLRPASIQDFLAKRAQVERHDLGTVKLAMQMAGSANFEIGEPESFTPRFLEGESKADAEFEAWLLDQDNA